MKKRKNNKSYDQACFDLAEYFLIDEPSLQEHCSDLAIAIQHTVEDWFALRKIGLR
jgi:hypothetical protein